MFCKNRDLMQHPLGFLNKKTPHLAIDAHKWLQAHELLPNIVKHN